MVCATNECDNEFFKNGISYLKTDDYHKNLKMTQART